MTRRSFLPAALALLAAASLAGPADAALLEKIVDVPRETAIPVDLTYQRVTITTVETHNDPQPSDVDEAKQTDPGDKTFLIVRFRYKSDEYVKHRVKLHVVLLDAQGEVLGDASRRATLDPGVKEDTVSFPMKVKTLDWPKAAKMKVIASFLD